jgi:DUF4097 and DUF4098 domain-containing protein YvlB
MSMRVLFALLAALPVAALAGGIDKVNGSIHVEAGEKVEDVSTVNGSIKVGDDATVEEVETVNGGVTLGNRARAESVENVNGAITLGDGVQIAKDVETVNGAISLEKGADVVGHVSNVNGRIELDAAHIGGGIKTVNGDINVGASSRVENGILVEKSKSWGISFGKSEPPHIVIGPGAVVQGTLRFEREVKLYVSDRATVGTIEGATPIKFSGDRPPE